MFSPIKKKNIRQSTFVVNAQRSRRQRSSINATAVLDQDSNCIDYKDETYWRHLPDNTGYSPRLSLADSTSPILNSNSRIIDDSSINSAEWWNNLQNTNQDLLKRYTSVREISKINITNISTSTSASEANKTKKVRKRRVIFTRKRQSPGKNVFSQVLNSSEAAVESEPVRSNRREDSPRILTLSLDELTKCRVKKSRSSSNSTLLLESSTSTDTEQIARVRPALFKRPRKISRSSFDKILEKNDTVDDELLETNVQEVSSAKSIEISNRHSSRRCRESIVNAKEISSKKVINDSGRYSSKLRESISSRNRSLITEKTRSVSLGSSVNKIADEDDSDEDEELKKISEEHEEISNKSERVNKSIDKGKNDFRETDQKDNGNISITRSSVDRIPNKSVSQRNEDKTSLNRSRYSLRLSSSSTTSLEESLKVDNSGYLQGSAETVKRGNINVRVNISQASNGRKSKDNLAVMEELRTSIRTEEIDKTVISNNGKGNLNNRSNEALNVDTNEPEANYSENDRSIKSSTVSLDESLKTASGLRSSLYNSSPQEHSHHENNEEEVESDQQRRNSHSSLNNRTRKSLSRTTNEHLSNGSDEILKHREEQRKSYRRSSVDDSVKEGRVWTQQRISGNASRIFHGSKKRISEDMTNESNEQLKVGRKRSCENSADENNEEEVGTKRRSISHNISNASYTSRQSLKQQIIAEYLNDEDAEQFNVGEKSRISYYSMQNSPKLQKTVERRLNNEKNSLKINERLQKSSSGLQNTLLSVKLSFHNKSSTNIRIPEAHNVSEPESLKENNFNVRNTRNIDLSTYELQVGNHCDSESVSNNDNSAGNPVPVNSDLTKDVENDRSVPADTNFDVISAVLPSTSNQSGKSFKKTSPPKKNILDRYLLHSKNQLSQSTDQRQSKHLQKSNFGRSESRSSQQDLQELTEKLRKMKKATDKKIQKELEAYLKPGPIKIQTKEIISVNNHPKKKKNDNPKPVNRAYVINGEVYKQPKLPRPQKWATNRLYKFLWKKMHPKYGMKTRIKSEKFVMYLSEAVTIIKRRKKFKNYKDELEVLIRRMAYLGIVKTRLDFHHFCYDFLPYEFRIKVNPQIMPGNIRNIPFEPEKLTIPILSSKY